MAEEVGRGERLQQLGVLWQRKSDKGTNYFTGVLNNGVHGEVQVVIFKINEDYKRGENSPDWTMYRSNPRSQNGGNNTTGDDIPF